MKQSDFCLKPFAVNTTPELEITGSIFRKLNQLQIKYLLAGNLASIVIPPLNKTPTRQRDLWEHTCLEFFLGLKDSPKYWEFNLSPSGDWNVFRFANYRQNIAEELAFNSLFFAILQQTNSCQLNLEVDLNQIIDPEQNLEVGITAVIENQQQQLSYWALTHTTSVADFHQRDSFIINL
ncbi:DOMON-like domain-containing protein [Pleurocapsa sp. PCC 7319]|uniref:DOMON-like domain-containing protein n=1 Tax=Pleurocapsa sp. PCC 7319 TaxID=118161 RepID=UPI000349CBB3|nr:DOMON-like domain-containing protein [Pleurocapsa sp. PCC 7319]